MKSPGQGGPRSAARASPGVSKVTLYKIIAGFDAGRDLVLCAKLADTVIDGWSVKVFVAHDVDVQPAWSPLLSGLVQQSAIPLNAYASLVIVLQKGDATYALTAGYGYKYVKKWAQADFGIDVACRTVNQYGLISLSQKVPTGNVYGLNRVLRGKYFPASDRINRRSVLKALKGGALDPDFGTSLEGKTSLALCGKKSLRDVIRVLDKVATAESKNELTVKIGGLEEVPKERANALNQELARIVNGGTLDNVMFGYAEDFFDGKGCVSLLVGRSGPYEIDDVGGVLQAAKLHRPAEPTRAYVIGIDDQNIEVFNRPLIDLVEGELEYDGARYFRIDRKWYLTSPDYRQELERDFAKLETVESGYLSGWPLTAGRPVAEDEFLKRGLRRFVWVI